MHGVPCCDRFLGVKSLLNENKRKFSVNCEWMMMPLAFSPQFLWWETLSFNLSTHGGTIYSISWKRVLGKWKAAALIRRLVELRAAHNSTCSCCWRRRQLRTASSSSHSCASDDEACCHFFLIFFSYISLAQSEATLLFQITRENGWLAGWRCPVATVMCTYM